MLNFDVPAHLMMSRLLLLKNIINMFTSLRDRFPCLSLTLKQGNANFIGIEAAFSQGFQYPPIETFTLRVYYNPLHVLLHHADMVGRGEYGEMA